MPWELQDEHYRCPVCGERVYWEPDCPGYPGSYRLADGTMKQSVMVCSPACGNADYFYCADKTCPWWYREPNNRHGSYKYNVGSVEMGVKPTWFGVATGWRMSIEEVEDDDEEDEVEVIVVGAQDIMDDEEWIEDDTYDCEDEDA